MSHGSPDFRVLPLVFWNPSPGKTSPQGSSGSRDPSGPVWVMPDTHPSSSAVLVACLPGELAVADGLCRELVSSLGPGGQGVRWARAGAHSVGSPQLPPEHPPVGTTLL